jgi:hypothetical protein
MKRRWLAIVAAIVLSVALLFASPLGSAIVNRAWKWMNEVGCHDGGYHAFQRPDGQWACGVE